jgi:hypothetical protein
VNVVNHTPFHVLGLPGFDDEDRETLTAIVKGTFRIEPGRFARVAEDQIPLCFADEYWGEPGSSPIKEESDLVPFKPGTDLLLTGTAYAKDRKPTRKLKVTFTVGSYRKEATIVQDDARTKFPLVLLEHFTVKRDIFGKKHGIPGSGFGFYPRSWKPRLEYAGTFDEAWQEERAPFLPRDFDPRYYQAAYPDLVTRSHLKGGEEVHSENTTREGVLHFRLPKTRPAVALHLGSDRVEQSCALDTVRVQPDEHRVVLVWRSVFRCSGKMGSLRAIEVGESAERRSSESTE